MLKTDSKTQRRLQCSFNNFSKLLLDNKDRIITQNDTNILYDKQILDKIYSNQRIFNRSN